MSSLVDQTRGHVLLVTAEDHDRLTRLIDMARFKCPVGTEYLGKLEDELRSAHVVASSDIPADVVTMNSRVCLQDLDTAEEMEFTLVYPDRSDLNQSCISVLAPIGTAVLGYREGDAFEWQVPDGTRRLRVLRVLWQPEADSRRPRLD